MGLCGNFTLKPNNLRLQRSQKQFPLGNEIENTTLPFPERLFYCNSILKQQRKRLVKSRNRRCCCSHHKQLQQLQMSAFGNSLVEYFTSSLDEEDEISPPKIPSGTSKLIRGRPRLSKLRTSPRATHQA